MAQIIPMPKTASLVCSACGASGTGSCDCGAPYVRAGTRAAKAIAKNPEKSDRALAAELGVGSNTVRRARDKSTAPHGAVAKRIGKDGKARKLPRRPKLLASDPIQDSCADCETAEQHWQRSLSNLAGDAISMRAYWSRQFGEWEKFEVPSSLVTLARQAAEAWTKLARDFKKEKAT